MRRLPSARGPPGQAEFDGEDAWESWHSTWEWETRQELREEVCHRQESGTSKGTAAGGP